MREIFVVTHPEATHHLDGLVGGWYDSDLSPRGLRHAAAIAEALDERLAGRAVELYSSDLLRARRTAELIGQRLGVEVMVDSDLREKSYGVAGGKPQAWLDERIRPLPESGERLRHDEGIVGAETRLELATRAYAAMQRIVGASAAHQVIVTHGGTAPFLFAAWIEMPIKAAGRVHFKVSSGGITLLRRDDIHHSHQITELNRVDHLAD